MASRTDFLAHISIKRLKRIQYIHYSLAYVLLSMSAIICDVMAQRILEQRFNPLTLLHQLFGCSIFIACICYYQKAKKSKMYLYAIMLISVLTSQPFQVRCQSLHALQSLNHTLFQINFVLAFDDVFELSLVALTIFLLNLQIRFYLHKPLDQRHIHDEVYWYEGFLEAINMAILLLIVILFKLEMNVNEC